MIFLAFSFSTFSSPNLANWGASWPIRCAKVPWSCTTTPRHGSFTCHRRGFRSFFSYHVFKGIFKKKQSFFLVSYSVLPLKNSWFTNRKRKISANPQKHSPFPPQFLLPSLGPTNARIVRPFICALMKMGKPSQRWTSYVQDARHGRVGGWGPAVAIETKGRLKTKLCCICLNIYWTYCSWNQQQVYPCKSMVGRFLIFPFGIILGLVSGEGKALSYLANFGFTKV